MVSGASLILAAVAVFAGVVLISRDGIVAGIGVSALVIGAVIVLAGLMLLMRPPVVVRLDAQDIRSRRMSIDWTTVETVDIVGGMLVLDGDQLSRPAIRLSDVGDRQAELVAEVYQRLNTAHGYRRFDA